MERPTMVKIWCDVTCAKCGAMLGKSGYYSPKRIKAIKTEAKEKGWKQFDGSSYCAECLKEEISDRSR